jgi:delta-aminolevulinic acid dehydratase/porphobilinogen synthase
VITDVCVLPAYEHKNCGVVEKGTVRKDPLLELIARVAVSHAEARADVHEQASIPRTSTQARAHFDPSREQ